MRRLLFLLMLLTLAAPVAAQVAFETDDLSIETAEGTHEFQVEIARTGEERAQGLMFRRQLAADAGMLFLFGGSEVRGMWMKNTYIPLDMLFIDAAGKIVRIEERTVPFSERAIVSGSPVAAVLELNAGTASRLKIRPGDRVRHSAFD